MILLGFAVVCVSANAAVLPPSVGAASWYGESHRGRLMANGKRFNPDNLTAASWFYPLGTRVRVTLDSVELNGRKAPPRTIVVTITDRGPARRLVRDGRIIDLTTAAFRALAPTDLGLVPVRVQPEIVRPATPPAPVLAVQVPPATKNRS
jgi:rare lipoprotein A